MAPSLHLLVVTLPDAGGESCPASDCKRDQFAHDDARDFGLRLGATESRTGRWGVCQHQAADMQSSTICEHAQGRAPLARAPRHDLEEEQPAVVIKTAPNRTWLWNEAGGQYSDLGAWTAEGTCAWDAEGYTICERSPCAVPWCGGGGLHTHCAQRSTGILAANGIHCATPNSPSRPLPPSHSAHHTSCVVHHRLWWLLAPGVCLTGRGWRWRCEVCCC